MNKTSSTPILYKLTLKLKLVTVTPGWNETDKQKTKNSTA